MDSSDLQKIDGVSGKSMATPGYVCPDCKAPLDDLYCPRCRFEFPCVDGVPRLLSNDLKFERTQTIAEAYDSIYAAQSNVWENQGKTPELFRYLSSLLDQFPSRRLLEIGCGEGFLLASLRNGEKFAVDLSLEAIRKARAKAQAHFSLAQVERLPYPADYFELVTSIGVMEHFLDIGEALREIRRILKPGGYYVSLTHVDLTIWERIAMKISDFIFPRPQPIRFIRWLRNKLKSGVSQKSQEFARQPIQHRYTTRGAKAWLAQNGFTVVDILHRRKYPDLPLKASWVVIYIAQK